MSEFEKLAGDLETLAKSSGAADDAATDKKIEAAAGAAGEAAAAGEGAAGKGPGDEGDGDDDDPVLGKSFALERDGKTIQAYDATELLKSLTERLEAVEDGMPERQEHLGKSLNLIADLLKSQDATIKTQAEKIDALTQKVESMGGEGRGRKTVVTLVDKPGTGLHKAQSDQPTGQEILAKCLSAQKEGRLTGMDVSRADAAIGNGVQVPNDILARLQA